MIAVILAGGKGTRLAGVITDVPKPMAPVGGRPFLELLLDMLRQRGASGYILCVSHLYETIIDHFHDSYKGVPVAYSIEREPLGTGGAIRQAFRSHNIKQALVLNGDTWLEADYLAFYHKFNGFPLAMMLKHTEDASRFGRVNISDANICGFEEKSERSMPGLVNAGVYRMESSLIDLMPDGAFSLEKDFLEQYSKRHKFPYMKSNGYFIDIGIPQSYAQACGHFAKER